MVNSQLKLRIVTADPKIVFEVVRRVKDVSDLDSIRPHCELLCSGSGSRKTL